MKDKAAMEAIVKASGVDWIIVRLPFINDDPGTGNTHVFSTKTAESAHKLTPAGAGQESLDLARLTR